MKTGLLLFPEFEEDWGRNTFWGSVNQMFCFGQVRPRCFLHKTQMGLELWRAVKARVINLRIITRKWFSTLWRDSVTLLGERLKSKVNSTRASWDKSSSLFCLISLLYSLHFLVKHIHSASRPKVPFSSAFSVSFLPPPSSLVWYHKSPNNWGRENFPEKEGR